MRPFELLPMPMPAKFDPGVDTPDFFYFHFLQPFVPDMVRMMDVGIPIDDKAVEALRATIDNVLQTVEDRLKINPIITKFQIHRLPAAQRKHAEESTQSVRKIDHYLKEYKPGDMIHRTYVVNFYLQSKRLDKDQREKWSVKDLKQYNIWMKDPFITAIIDKRPLSHNKNVQLGMLYLAKCKLDIWNKPRYERAEEPVPVELFNPGSAKQKQELFYMLKIPAMAYSKDTGEASWGREYIEELLKQTDEPEMVDMLEAFIDHSYSAIIRNNFLKAFDSYTIDGVLHGNIRLFGAKSCRNTSNSPNLLNAPSTRSIYAKPLKRCFRAPDGHVIYAVDLKALEDRVIANLTGDTNKQNVFLEGIDGHSLNACGYWPARIAKVMGSKNTDNVPYVKEFYRRVEEDKNTILTDIRFKSKAPTFKLAYGGYPDADRGGAITQEIFDNYHNILYPEITKYREEYVLPTTQKNGYIHLGLGCRMYSDNPEDNIRTLHNATVQFWSILTLIAINEFNYRIDQEGLQKEVQVCSTIYDSIYNIVTADAEILKWVNDNLIEIMCTPYIEDEVIHNEAVGEIGLNWADLHKIPNGASELEIDDILTSGVFGQSLY